MILSRAVVAAPAQMDEEDGKYILVDNEEFLVV
jgi:hypothetical protein